MAGRVVFLLERGAFEPAYHAGTMALTALAMGEEVVFVFSFDALRELVHGTYGRARDDRERTEQIRAEAVSVPKPVRMLEEARTLGARFLVCDTMLKICGLDPAKLHGKAEVVGLPTIWRLTQDARVVTL